MRADPAPAVTPAAISALVRGAVGTGPIQPVQPGQLIRAIVLSVADDGLLSIAMPGGRTVAARTEVPVRPGSQVEVEVEAGPRTDGAAAPLRFVVRGAIAPAPPQPPTAPAPPAADVQRAQAVAVAATTAAQGQAGIAPLMADLSQAMVTQNPPAAVVAAARQLLARQTSVERPITHGAVRQSLSQSGLFMEQRLTGPLPAQTQPTDLKALLLVLRQAATAWSRAAAAEPPVARPTSVAAPAAAAKAAAPQGALPGAAASPAAPDAASAPPASRPSAPAAVAAPVVQGGGAALARSGPTRPAPPISAPLADLPDPVARAAAQATPPAAHPPSEPAAIAPRPARPPPPYRGAPTTAQAPAAPTLAADTPAAAAARRIVQGAEAALARQDLLQIASLPDAPRTAAAAESASRWMFDMPLATPQGPAVAQFEISRDGGGTGAGGGEAARIWRARFSIDIEPMGPVHAQLAMGDGRIAVALWAEREESLAALRLQEADLARALGDGEHPAEVAIHPGAPRISPAAAGRFLDVAS